MSTGEVLPGSVLLMTCEAFSSLPPLVTLTSPLTLVSALLPPFSTITVNVGLAPEWTWLTAGAGCSVLAPTLTPVTQGPGGPGGTAPLLALGGFPGRPGGTRA